MRRKNEGHVLGLMAAILFAGSAIGQTTGKIGGIVIDKATREPLIGANVMLVGTTMGTVADLQGNFYIINIFPGAYAVQASMIGYRPVRMQNVRISVNSTTTLRFEMEKTVLQGDPVIVTASAVSFKKDQTSSIRNVSADQLARLPVEDVNQVVNMQAGIVAGHFRGGRTSESAFMIDGLQVINSFSEYSRQSVYVEKETVQDLEVIKGTFDAEYGRAMSGMVNAVTKDGGNTWRMQVSSGFSNFLTSHDDVFIGLGNSGALSRNLSRDYKTQIEGPILRDRLTFFVNYRKQDNRGPINGIRRFNPWDYSVYPANDPASWHIEHTGDNEYVAMQQDFYDNLLAKLTVKPFSNFKVNLLYTFNGSKSRQYDFAYKYNPDGLGWNFGDVRLGSADVNHMLSRSLYYNLKLSYSDRREKSYLYENPLDPRYISPNYHGSQETGFYTGGMAGPGKRMDAFLRGDAKFDLYWQAGRNHGIKTGFQVTSHVVDRDRIDVRNLYDGLSEANDMAVDWETGKITFPNYIPEIIPITENTVDIYRVKPYEMSGYIQDKMEFEEMVIKLGLRYDYFNANYHYPSNFRNPANQLSLPDSMMSTYPGNTPQTQFSPRLGLSYKLSDQAVLRFSYGHFFQMPQMYALFEDNIFRVSPFNYQTTMGNSQLKAEKTVQYELGIWQQLMPGMGLEVSVYYKDIYNLLSTKVMTTYNQIRYGLFTNKDYGNARGIELTWDYMTGGLSSIVNFTYAFTRGVADNPRETFTRAGNSMDPISRLIPLSWDQLYTANATVAYSMRNFDVALTGYLNSGTPYSYAPPGYSPLYRINLYQNNSKKPVSTSFDLSAGYTVPLFGRHSLRLTLNAYNLFDRLNAAWVYSDTGDPGSTIVTEGDLLNHRSDFNDYYDRINNPTAYSYPRSVKLTVGYGF
jgi:outer membrane receptor protein involved in Fe transport